MEVKKLNHPLVFGFVAFKDGNPAFKCFDFRHGWSQNLNSGISKKPMGLFYFLKMFPETAMQYCAKFHALKLSRPSKLVNKKPLSEAARSEERRVGKEGRSR